MRKIESLFMCAGTAAMVVGVSAAIWNFSHRTHPESNYKMPETNFGSFLAAQHAVYVNDFEAAARFAGEIRDVEYATIQNTRYLADFLSGKMPTGAHLLKEEKAAASGLIYDTYLVTENKWDELYKRHKKDESPISSALRIWSSVATGRVKDALKFIDDLPTNKAWKAFVRGQIYATTGDAERAAREFADVPAEFLNINDYLYLLSFYQNHDMFQDVDILRNEFTSRPGGAYMLGYENIPEWKSYSGYKNALAFGLVQTVSHTHVMMYSDLSIIFMRMAGIIGTDFVKSNSDTVDYYLGQYFFNNRGDYNKYFSRIPRHSPFYLFVVMRGAEDSGDMTALADAMGDNPLFVSGAKMLISHHIANGNRRAALRVVNRALRDKNLNEVIRAFFMKTRAHIHYMFGDYDDAQSDLYDASAILKTDADILSLQSKIWVAQNRQIEDAYDYAMKLVKINPTDIFAWDTLGRVVYVREGHAAAIEVLERVGEVATTCSSLFAQLGDLYAEQGDSVRARAAYLRAIDLADDGLVIIPEIKQKLRKVK